MIQLTRIASRGMEGTANYKLKLVPFMVDPIAISAVTTSLTTQFDYTIDDFKPMREPTMVLMEGKWEFVAESVTEVIDMLDAAEMEDYYGNDPYVDYE